MKTTQNKDFASLEAEAEKKLSIATENANVQYAKLEKLDIRSSQYNVILRKVQNALDEAKNAKKARDDLRAKSKDGVVVSDERKPQLKMSEMEGITFLLPLEFHTDMNPAIVTSQFESYAINEDKGLKKQMIHFLELGKNKDVTIMDASGSGQLDQIIIQHGEPLTPRASFSSKSKEIKKNQGKYVYVVYGWRNSRR